MRKVKVVCTTYDSIWENQAAIKGDPLIFVLWSVLKITSLLFQTKMIFYDFRC